MPNRVLVIGEYGILNGGENSFLTVAPSLQESGWDICAAVPEPSEFAQACNAIGISTQALSMHLDGQRKSQSQIRTEIAEMIGVLQPDLIHCNSLSTSRLCGPIARELNVPSIGYIRDILKLSRKAVEDINQLDRIIAVSQATKQWHCDAGIDASKTFVVFNGVDTDLFSPRLALDSPRALNIPQGVAPTGPNLIFVGQIGMRKGVDILLDAFLRVANQIPASHLLIVGSRQSTKQEAVEYEGRLRAQSSDSQHAQRIHWLGRRTDVADLMRISTLLVHPARQEPLGRVLLEASATGLPFLTTRVGGSPEILSEPDLQELLFEPNDVDSLASKIVELLGHPAQRKTLGQRLRNQAQQRFSIPRCAAQLNRHYGEILRN